ncbi:MAG: hypothetical protein WAU07_02050 [Microgenomates group bacterium]
MILPAEHPVNQELNSIALDLLLIEILSIVLLADLPSPDATAKDAANSVDITINFLTILLTQIKDPATRILIHEFVASMTANKIRKVHSELLKLYAVADLSQKEEMLPLIQTLTELETELRTKP